MAKQTKKTKVGSIAKIKDTGTLISDLYEDDGKSRERKLQFISFRLGSEQYGVEISKVKDVSLVAAITFLPCAPSHIVGIVNLRGNIVSVTDVRKLLGLNPASMTKENHLLIIQSGDFETGIAVDETPKAMEVELSRIDPPPDTLDPSRAEYIVGVCKLKDVFFAILNVEKILAFKG